MSETVVEEPPPGPARYCGYGQCGRILPPQEGTGRKREYCEDRRWDGNKTCKQMAQVERAAVKVAGLDMPLTVYRQTTEKVLPALEAVRAQIVGPLAELTDAVRGVETGALARVTEEEQVAGAAVARADKLAAERDKALTARDNALREAKESREATLAARGLQREAEREAEVARGKMFDHEGARAGAEAKAAEVGANLTAQIERYNRLTTKIEAIEESNKKLTKDNTSLDTALKTAQAERATAEGLAAQRAQEVGEAGAAKAGAESARDAALGELERVRTELSTVNSANAQLRGDLERARGELSTEQATTAELRKQAAADKAHAESLVAELSTANSTSAQLRTTLETEQVTIATLRADLASAEARAAMVEELRGLLIQRGGEATS
jgi:chromosome segregation ATPase